NKLQSIKFIVTTIMSLLALYIIYTTKNPGAFSAEYALILVGVLFMVLGNYFKTLRANYFLGIRTPWTLENEVVWRETHKLGGALWFVGGILVVINSIFIEGQLMHTIFMVITGIMVLVPVAYSYWKFNSLTRHEKSSGSWISVKTPGIASLNCRRLLPAKYNFGRRSGFKIPGLHKFR